MDYRMAVLATIGVLWASSARAEPLCFDPKESDAGEKVFATRLEQIFSDPEVERAWRSFRPGAEVGTSKSPLGPAVENANILFDAFLMQRAYRLRAELELAEKSGAAPTEIDARRKAFETARENFCKSAGHGFVPEFRPDFDKETQ